MKLPPGGLRPIATIVICADFATDATESMWTLLVGQYRHKCWMDPLRYTNAPVLGAMIIDSTGTRSIARRMKV